MSIMAGLPDCTAYRPIDGTIHQTGQGLTLLIVIYDEVKYEVQYWKERPSQRRGLKPRAVLPKPVLALRKKQHLTAVDDNS